MGLLVDLMIVPCWPLLEAAMAPGPAGPWLEDSL